MKSSPREEKRAEESAGDTEQICVQENGGDKGCCVFGLVGEENNAEDDWSSRRPDMRWENWNCPQGIQEY